MGNSTGSTMYMFGAVIVIYIVGMLIYQGGFSGSRKKGNRKKTKNSEEVTNSGRYNYSTDRNCFAWVCTEGFYQTF